MARRIARKTFKQDEFIEAAFDAGEWIEKHWRTAACAAGGVLLLVLIGAGWNWWSRSRAAEVGNLVSEGLAFYTGQSPAAGGQTAPSYSEALPLFEQAARKGGTSVKGRIAAYYQAATLVRLGRAREAVPLLEEVASGAKEQALADSARALLAEAYAASGDAEKALAAYKVLSEQAGSTFPPDMALLRMGKLLRGQGKTQEAKLVWQDLLAKYPESGSAAEARALLPK